MPETPFDINRLRDGSQSGAMLPTLGTRDLRLPIAFQVDGVDAYIAALHATMDDALHKTSDALVEAAKAMGVTPPQAFSYSSMSFMPDPANYGLMQWPGLNAESLRKITKENVAPITIIRQRVDDMARYSQVSSHNWKPGWRIVLREASATPTAQDRKDIKEATKFIYNCSMDGTLDPEEPMDPRERDAHLIAPFEMFLRSFADDALTFDGWSIWTDMDSEDRVRAYANLPAGMIRLAVPTRGYRGNPRHFAALVDETGTPVKPFTRKEMTWRIRNVRNDPSVGPHGWAEAEMAIKLLQAFQGAIELNSDVFQKNGIPNGMLLLKGDYFNQEQIDALMREWTNMKRGVSKLWGMPVMSVPEDGDVEILNFMDLKGQEVRYKDHMNMMMGLCCLVWRFPIRRLGMFVSGQHRDNAPVQDAAIEIQGADDPGMPPLLIHVEETINPYILWSRWPKLRFEFTSKNPKEDARQYEERKMARTWGEARAEADLPELSKLYKGDMGPLADIMSGCPEDPVKASVYQTVATTMLEAALGISQGAEGEGEGGGSAPKKGPSMMRQKDPANSQGHGHMAGIRRDSRAERDSAASKVKEST
jgi:hypothetical protein